MVVLKKPNDVRLYKIDVIVEEDLIRVANLKLVLFNDTPIKTFNNFSEWKNYFYCKLQEFIKMINNEPCDNNECDYPSIIETYYFKRNAFRNSYILKKQLKNYIKLNRYVKMKEVQFKF